MINARESDLLLKQRLKEARRATYRLDDSDKLTIKTLLKHGTVSKKAICTFFSITYKELKLIRDNKL